MSTLSYFFTSARNSSWKVFRNLFMKKIMTDIQHSNFILTQLSDDMQQTFKDVFTNEFVSKLFDSHNAHPVFQYVVNLTFSF